MSNKLQKEIIKDLTTQLNWKLDQIFIEGLRLKGFTFDKKTELEEFVRKNCRCEDNTSKSERVYYANDIPFLIHYYKANFGIKSIFDKDQGTHKMEADYGSFAYL